MKKTIALSFLLSATSVILGAAPSLAQVIPITGGTYTLNGTLNRAGGYDVTIAPSNVLSPAGVISLTAIINYSYSGTTALGAFSISATTSNNFVFGQFPTRGTNLALTGDASGSVGGNAFTTKPIVINGTVGNGSQSSSNGVVITSFGFQHNITGGSLDITVPVVPPVVVPPAPPVLPPPQPVLPPPPCQGCLTVTPNLLISNNVLLGKPVNEHNYIEPKDDFRLTSFSSRVLYLEDK